MPGRANPYPPFSVELPQAVLYGGRLGVVVRRAVDLIAFSRSLMPFSLLKAAFWQEQHQLSTEQDLAREWCLEMARAAREQ